jgi:hypothetical protein
MEITLEKIDSLRERANVSYADAKAALEANDGNMIDAIIYLESENRTVYDRAKREDSRRKERARYEEKKEKYRSQADDIAGSAKKLFKNLNETRVVMYNDDRVIFDVSMTITLVSTLFFFPFALGVFVIGLLTGNRFKVIRKDKKSDPLNDVLEKAAKVSQNVAETLKEKVNNLNTTEVNEDHEKTEA